MVFVASVCVLFEVAEHLAAKKAAKAKRKAT